MDLSSVVIGKIVAEIAEEKLREVGIESEGGPLSAMKS